MRAVAVLIMLELAATARAETAPPPSWIDGAPKTPDLDGKVDGTFPDALPLINYDPNFGVGYGVGAHLTFDGPSTDPLFDYEPYRHRLYLQLYASTLGLQQHFLSYDGLHVGGSPYHLNAVFFYEKNTNANYFGNGTATLNELNFQGQSFKTFDEATAAAGPLYYHYGYERPQGQVILERAFFGQKIRIHAGVNVQHVDITLYDAPNTSAPVGAAPSTLAIPTTKLGVDCASGAAIGCAGGWNNTVRAGIAYDTRDYAPDPKSGVFLDLTGQWSSRAFGSAQSYARLTGAARSYLSPFPKLADLVLATRAFYSIQSADVPFYALDTLAMATGADDVTGQEGLGGERTLRGYRNDRFIGPVTAGFNAEARWTFTHFDAFHQHFSLQFAPLLDVGRVYDQVQLSANDWKVCGGGALRIGWNKSTIIMFDFAVSKEDMGEFIDFGLPF